MSTIFCKYDELVNPRTLKPHPLNRNKHPIDQVERLAKLYEYHGIRHPIIVSRLSGLMVAGHGRKEAAIKAGLKEFPVVYQDFEDDQKEYAFIQSDNAIASWSELDLSGINSDIGVLGPDFDIDMLGIKNFTIDVADKFGDEDAVPEVPKEAKTKLGDRYQLGRHRLLCGDSTSIDAVETLMDGQKADLWLTDPPYGVGYKSNGAEDKHEAIENDNLPLDEMYEFWKTVASNAHIVTTDKCAYYWFACQGGDQMMMMMMSISDANWKVRHELIWNKDSLVMGRCDYHYKHEPILYGWKSNGSHKWTSDRKQCSVLDFKRPKKSEEHPTMKPVELVEYLMKNNTDQNDVVLDTFGGSGTTLIAAEKSNRSARLIEISPIYCDVIVSRWEKFTGKKAELVSANNGENNGQKE